MRTAKLRGAAFLGVCFAIVIFSLSCGSGSGGGGFKTGSGTGYVFIGDAPVPGSSILKFQITLSSATLCQTVGSSGECQGSSPVELLSAPVTIELSQLELRSTFLSSPSVAVGTFAGVKLVFSNPELKVLNTDGTIQELKGVNLPLSPTSVSPTFQSTVNVTDNSVFSFLIDLDINGSIQSSSGSITGIAPSVSLVKLPVTAQQTVEDLDDLNGTVGNLNKTCPSGSFDILDLMTGISIANVHFDGTSTFNTGLTCDTLVNGQTVETDLEFQAQSLPTVQLFANRLDLLNTPGDQTLEGVTVQVNPLDQVKNRYQFVLLVQEAQTVTALTDGALVTVNIDPTKAVFGINPGTLTVDPAGFAASTDLLAGQSVRVSMQSGSVTIGTNNCAAISDGCEVGAQSITLTKGDVTAQVSGTSQPNFTLTALPSIFGTLTLLRPLSADCQNCSIASALVATSTLTAFEGGLTSFTDLQIGNTVTVRGLLFKNGFQGPGPIGNGSPTLVASKVRLVAP